MNQHCQQCGTAVYNELPGGLCPACLMAAARQSLKDAEGTQAMPSGFRTPSLSEISRLFPEWEVLGFVGRGGMGAVYRVRQKNLDRVVALKVFLDRPDDPEFAARFQREARALARLNHPSIITVHDFGQREEMYYLLMEFVDGLNLRELTQEERLSPEMALQLVPQLCDALQFAHDHGVVHRDIKPENLLLDANGRIKIADFGLAKLAGGNFDGTLTRTQQVMGTFNYMAPEQRERPTEVDHRADIYSLGVVIYELLTGELPIGRFQPPSSKSAVSAQLDEVVMRALEKEPGRRYQQASDFKTGFESVNQFAEPAAAPAVAAATAGFAGGGWTAANLATGNADGAPTAQPQPPIKSQLRPGQRPNGTRCMFTLMSGREKKGNWHPGNPQMAMTLMGGTCLDLTKVESNQVHLILFTLMGGTEVIVPHGATVDLDGFILMGGTADHVESSHVQSDMHVRIQSWGAMGGCEVRTPKFKPEELQAAVNLHQNRKPAEKTSSFAVGLAFLYRLFAMLVTFAIPVIFLTGSFDVFDQDDCNLAGILTALAAGLIWSGSGYFRILIGAGPETTDETSLAEYYSASKIATAIRALGLVFVFACPALFIIASFHVLEFRRDHIHLAAILCGVVGAGIFALAGMVDAFLKNQRT